MFQEFGGALGTYTKFCPEIWFNGCLVSLPEKIGLLGSQSVPNRKVEDQAMAWSLQPKGTWIVTFFFKFWVFFSYFWGLGRNKSYAQSRFSPWFVYKNRAWVVKLKWPKIIEPGNSAGDLLWVPAVDPNWNGWKFRDLLHEKGDEVKDHECFTTWEIQFVTFFGMVKFRDPFKCLENVTSNDRWSKGHELNQLQDAGLSRGDRNLGPIADSQKHPGLLKRRVQSLIP